MRLTTYRQKASYARSFARLTVVLISLSIVVPGSGGGLFDGFPLDSLPELFALLLIIVFTGSNAAWLYLTRIFQITSPAIRIFVVALPLVIVILKPILHANEPIIGGFDSCYTSLMPSDDLVNPKCEPFFSRLGEGGRSRIDKVIDFHGWSYPLQDNYLIGSNWNLSFVNNPHFAGRYPPYEHIRHIFKVDWLGQIDSPYENGVLPILYTGEGVVNIAGILTPLPINYGDPKVFWVKVKKGIQSFNFSYKFNNPVGQSGVIEPPTELKGFYATVRVGEIRQTPDFSHVAMVAWAIHPETHSPVKSIQISQDGKLLSEVRPTIFRPDVFNYRGEEVRPEPIGFIIPNLNLVERRQITAVFDDGKSKQIAEVVDGELKYESFVSNDLLWANIDTILPSLKNFNALKPAVASDLAKVFGLLVDFVVVANLLLFAFILLLVHRLKFIFISLIGVAAYQFEKFINRPSGFGYDQVEGSTIVPSALLACAILLVPLCFIYRKWYLPVALFSSLFLAVDRTLHLNPGIRWDHFTPATNQISNMGYVFFRPAASDWLIHAWLIRGALFGGFLLGFEPVFYMQPGYRYVASGLHWFFGDGDILITVFISLALAIGSFFLIDTVLQRSINRFDQLVAAILTLGVLFIFSSWVISYFFLAQATEAPTWGFTVAAIALALRAKSQFFHSIFPAFLIGGAVVTRPNQLIGAFAVLLTILSLSHYRDESFSKSIQRWSFAIITFITVTLLPLLHNLYFGKQFELFSTGRPPGKFFQLDALGNFILGFLYQYRFRDATETGISGLPMEGKSITLEIGVYLLLVSWLIVLVRLFRDRPREVKPWIYHFFPFSYLFPMYAFHGYFPRHAVIFWISILGSVSISLSYRKEPIYAD